MLAATVACMSYGGDIIATNGLGTESSNESLEHVIFVFLSSLTFAFATPNKALAYSA